MLHWSASRLLNVATAALRPCSSVGRPSGAGLFTTGFVAFLALANFLEAILTVGLATLPDEILRLALGNFLEGIFFLPVEKRLDGGFAMTASLVFDALSRLSNRKDGTL